MFSLHKNSDELTKKLIRSIVQELDSVQHTSLRLTAEKESIKHDETLSEDEQVLQVTLIERSLHNLSKTQEVLLTRKSYYESRLTDERK